MKIFGAPLGPRSEEAAGGAGGSRLDVRRTRHGLRLSQHGVVISELRTSPGPTHSVFDLLAGLMALHGGGKGGRSDVGRTALLGFAGGGMLAPLRALRWAGTLETCDLDRGAYELFLRHCPGWSGGVRWARADAGRWLRRQRGAFDLIVEDLSVPAAGDVTKPALCWVGGGLPELMRERLRPGGWAVFNLLPPLPERPWRTDVGAFARLFPAARVILLQDYENRLVVGGQGLPSARALSVALRRALSELGSSQARRFSVHNLNAYARTGRS